MLDLPQNMTADSATLALCWRVARRDGVVLGFTQHDADLTFGGITHRASSGLDVAHAQRLLGLAEGEAELLGALVSESLTQDDILAGLYDQASVETWLADWQDPSCAALVDCGTIGRIESSDQGFRVELRSVVDRLMQPQGRLFQAHCAADLGDGRCGVDLSSPALRYQTRVLATDGRTTLTVSAGGYADDWFSRGVMTVLDGANSGMRIDIKTHDLAGTQARIGLWQSLPHDLVGGERVVLVAGCDKTATTCQARFGNIANFRGFPRMPGTDLLVRRVTDGEAGMDGGSLFQ